MWHWIIRVYASIVLFLFFMFCSGLVLLRVAHAFVKIGSPILLQEIHLHLLLTMFLLGMVSGQIFLGPKFTGSRWFRSKDGQTDEGFKFEEIKPWTWLFGIVIFGLGVVLWRIEQIESSVFLQPTLSRFFHDFLTPDCSNVRFADYRSDIALTCFMQLLFVGILVASVGYSLAPFVRKAGTSLIERGKQSNARIEMKEKADE